MKTILSLICLSLLALFTLPGCQTTGNLKADATSLWNSPAVQAELAQIQTMAINFVNKFLQTKLGAKRSITSSRSQAITEIKAAHPNAPDTVIANAVDAQFARVK